MSKDFYIYRIRKFTDDELAMLNDVVDIDNDELPRYFERVDLSDDGDTGGKYAYLDDIATRINVKYTTIDLFSAIEDICGERPTSLTYNTSNYYYDDFEAPDDIIYTAQFEDGSIYNVTRETLRKYRVEVSKPALAFIQDAYDSLDSTYWLDCGKIGIAEQGELTHTVISNIIEQYIDYLLSEEFCDDDDSEDDGYTPRLFPSYISSETGENLAKLTILKNLVENTENSNMKFTYTFD